MEGGPSGYINNLFDICFEQVTISFEDLILLLKRFEMRRSVIASFLNTMISNKYTNDDEKKSAVELLLNLTVLSISPNLAIYSELAKYEDSQFMIGTQPESRLEVCLLTLACLHKNLDNSLK